MIAHPGREAVHVVHLCTGATVGHAVFVLSELDLSPVGNKKSCTQMTTKEQTTIDIYGIEKILARML